MTTFNVLSYPTSTLDAEAEVIDQALSYSEALEQVIYAADGDVLAPLNAPDVAALRPYGALQVWELRDAPTGEKMLLLAIQEVQE